MSEKAPNSYSYTSPDSGERIYLSLAEIDIWMGQERKANKKIIQRKPYKFRSPPTPLNTWEVIGFHRVLNDLYSKLLF